MGESEWSTNATESTEIVFWRAGSDEPSQDDAFAPAFTYPIFGDEESIFGYKDLRIHIDFAAHDLRPAVHWDFADKFKTVGDTEALDLKDAFADFVPEGAFQTQEAFVKQLQAEDASSFTPPGEKVRSWTKDGRNYEIWAGQLTEPAVRRLVDRIQILVPLFIEGGQELHLDDQDWTIARWRVFFVYEKLAQPSAPTASPYQFVGYCTTYRFVTFEPTKWGAKADKTHESSLSSTADTSSAADFDVLSLPYRGRISQFLILPTHARRGHGAMLYATIFTHFHSDASCVEITVEDPNEAFDDLRDYCDFTRLLQLGVLEKIRLNHNVDPKLLMYSSRRRLPTDEIVRKELLATIRRENKIAPRQFKRLVELWLLSRIPATARQPGTARLTRKAKTADEADRAYYFWRLLVKQRLWNQNKDTLKDLERSEAVKHLEDTVDNLVMDYERLLAVLAEKAMKSQEDGAEAAGDEAGPSESRKRSKRHLVVDDDDDEEEEDGRGKRQKSVLDA